MYFKHFCHSESCLSIFFKDVIYLFESESELVHVSWAGSRGKGKESQANSMLSVKPHASLHLTILRSRPEPKPKVGCWIDWATQVPHRWLTLNHLLGPHQCSYNFAFLCSHPAPRQTPSPGAIPSHPPWLQPIGLQLLGHVLKYSRAQWQAHRALQDILHFLVKPSIFCWTLREIPAPSLSLD